jgi:hypothetical protein
VFVAAWQRRLVDYVRVINLGEPLAGQQPAGMLQLTLAGDVLGAVPLTVWQGP